MFRYKNLFLAMFAVAAAFVIMITVGFQIQGGAHPMSDGVLGTILGIGIGVVALCIMGILGGFPGGFLQKSVTGGAQPDPVRAERISQLREQAKRDQLAYRESQQQRIAILAANPATRKYAQLMERGGHWTDGQIAYNEDPNLTGTCVHLRPIERAMRSAGIQTRLLTATWKENYAPLPKIQADCRINESELQRQFHIADPVRYQQGYQPERSEFDNPWASLTCTQCQSSIALEHPDRPRPGAKWFPQDPV